MLTAWSAIIVWSGSESLITGSDLDQLEASGSFLGAHQLLCEALRSGQVAGPHDQALHRLGRLNQRLNRITEAERAYHLALQINPARPATINNLAVLRMAALDYLEADHWLSVGLALPGIQPQDRSLLLNSACELRLYQQRPSEARDLAEEQIRVLDQPRAQVNLSLSLRALNDLEGALCHQQQAVQQWSSSHVLDDAALLSCIGRRRDEGLSATIQFHLTVMNFAIARLSIDPFDRNAQQLLLSGAGIEPFSWADSNFFSRLWRGQSVEELVLWHDQGYGDAIQNLVWIRAVSQRVDCLRLFVRPSLMRLVQDRMSLPTNCRVEAMNPQCPPWHLGCAHLGLWFVPLKLGGWGPDQPQLQPCSLLRSRNAVNHAQSPRIGLVWMAGRHQAPQPELAARLRDLPFDHLKQRVPIWTQRFQAQCFSLQLDTDHPPDGPVRELVDRGMLATPLTSSGDWLDTLQLVETMDFVLTVDTAMAHLCGAVGIPCVVLLNAPCDWRWGQSGDRTFLYDSIRLARCPTPHAWDQAMVSADRWIAEWMS